MENVFFTSDPIMVLLITMITVALIILGRKFEIAQLPLIIVGYSLLFLVYHTTAANSAVVDIPNYYFSIVVDLVFLFLGFITYLWIDNIVAKNKNLKSYGDPLSWFWDKL